MELNKQKEIKPIKDSWNREELIEFCRKAFQAGVAKGVALEIFNKAIVETDDENKINEAFDKIPPENKWIEENI